jgi:DNA-binding transcriptional MerR regulator
VTGDDWVAVATRNARSVQTTVGWIFWDPGAAARYEALGLAVHRRGGLDPSPASGLRISGVDDLFPIGIMARRTGLTLRALRLYDAVGLLRPVDVDPATGYRRYAEEQVAQAVLIARLRDADVPLSVVAAIVAEPEGASRRALLDAWWAGREHDVVRQRDLVAAAGRLLEQEISMTTHTIDTASLTTALAAVLRCTSDDDETPAIGGVLLERSADGVRLVATDKYRLAVWDLPGAGTGGDPVILDATSLTAILGALDGEGTVAIELTEDAVTLRRTDGQDPVPTIAGTYPDYRRLIDAVPPIATVTVDRLALRAAAAVPLPDGTAMRLVATGTGLRVGDVELDATVVGDAPMVALNPQYLLDGLDALEPSATVDLEVSGQHTPLVLRAPGVTGLYLLMPVRVDEPVTA